MNRSWLCLALAIAGGIAICRPNFVFAYLALFSLGIALIGLKLWFTSDPASVVNANRFQIQVLEDPRIQTDRFQSLNYLKQQTFLADIVSADNRELKVPALVSTSEGDWKLGDVLACSGKAKLAFGLHRYQVFLICDSVRRIQSESRLQKLAADIRQAMQSVVSGLSPQTGAELLPGIVLGDVSQVRAIEKNAMQAAGLGHLTAVSGANVAIVLSAVGFLLTWFRIRISYRVFVQLLVLGLFVFVVRPSPSVVRAAGMAMLGLWLVWSGRKVDALKILITASFALLVIDPLLAVSWGFMLSVAATLGLISFTPLFVSRESSIWRMAVATAVSASLATLPLLIMMGRPPTFAAIPANVLAEIFVAPATITGISAAVLAWLGNWLPPLMMLGVMLAQLGVWCAGLILGIANWANQSWWATSVWSVTSLSVCIAGWLVYRLTKQVLISIAAAGLLLTLLNLPNSFFGTWPGETWQVIGCDVGQGDATLINLGNQAAAAIDAGPDPALFLKCLRAAGVSRISLLLFTHLHADHVLGADGMSSEIPVDSVALPCSHSPVAGFGLVNQLTSTEFRLRQGDEFVYPRVRIQVLTCPDLVTSTTDGSDINNSSAVFAVFTASHSFLITGDIETSAQELLMNEFDSKQFDVVKVPHHGSRSQADAFAAWSGAKWAWVSVGVDNVYGHPAPETLANYRGAGIRLWSTENCGSIAFIAQGVTSLRNC